MPWTNIISACFGASDKKFALHNSDRQAAQSMLREALSSGVGFSDYEKAIRSWLISEGVNHDHISNEMRRVLDLSTYFSRD